MRDKAYRIFNSAEYDEWFAEQTAKSQVQILGRIANVQNEGHFGDHKSVGGDVWELRWQNGRRVYYAYLPAMSILLILGGNKNGQEKDIRQAKKILSKFSFLER